MIAKQQYNMQFGSMLRTFHQPTYFSARLMRMADIYMSRLPNLIEYNLANHVSDQ